MEKEAKRKTKSEAREMRRIGQEQMRTTDRTRVSLLCGSLF